MTRLGALADLHLGKSAGYPGRLEEQRDVVIAAFERFNEEDCDAVLIAGDIFEGPIPRPEEYAAFTDALSVLHIPTVAVRGNNKHDSAYRSIAAPAVVVGTDFAFYSEPGIYANERALGLRVACLPWAHVGNLVAASNGKDRDAVNADAVTHLLTIARGLRERIGPGYRTVLLTHFGITGGTDNLERVAREPILPVEELAELGFDAVISGHYHRGEIYCDDPLILMCGSPYPLDHSEGAYGHGAWIVEVGR